MSQRLNFSDPIIIKAIAENKNLTEIRFSKETYIELKILETKIKARPPSTSESDCQLVFYDQNTVVGIILWCAELEVPHTILRLNKGRFTACSLVNLKDFLIKRSDLFAGWLLWNIV